MRALWRQAYQSDGPELSATDDTLLRLIVAAINAATAESASPMGYILVLGDMDTGRSMYVSNLQREGAVDTLQQVVEGLTEGTIVPGHGGLN